MAPDKVLSMSSALFWAMNAQIERIYAEQDLRSITVGQCSMSSDNAKKTVERLSETKGEVYRYGGGWTVKAEEGAGKKLLSLMGN